MVTPRERAQCKVCKFGLPCCSAYDQEVIGRQRRFSDTAKVRDPIKHVFFSKLLSEIDDELTPLLLEIYSGHKRPDSDRTGMSVIVAPT